MDTLKNIFEVHALEIGIFIVVLCKLIILIQLITTNKSKKKNSKSITLKSFIKDWLFLLFILFYGLALIFKNLNCAV